MVTLGGQQFQFLSSLEVIRLMLSRRTEHRQVRLQSNKCTAILDPQPGVLSANCCQIGFEGSGVDLMCVCEVIKRSCDHKQAAFIKYKLSYQQKSQVCAAHDPATAVSCYIILAACTVHCKGMWKMNEFSNNGGNGRSVCQH